jgi:hypothetical protein
MCVFIWDPGNVVVWGSCCLLSKPSHMEHPATELRETKNGWGLDFVLKAHL